MKNLLLLSICIVFSGCFSMKDYVLDSDYSYKGRFNKYRTFDFMLDENTEASDQHNEIVLRTIRTRMLSMGYSQSDKKPDLLITYKFYRDDFSFMGYDQPEFNGWVSSNYGGNQIDKRTYDSTEENDVSDLVEDRITEDIQEEDDDKSADQGEYKTVKKEMLEGMIYLTFFDAKKNNTIWSGYMSGVFHDNKAENERFLRASVGKILDDYKVLARGYRYYN